VFVRSTHRRWSEGSPPTFSKPCSCINLSLSPLFCPPLSFCPSLSLSQSITDDAPHAPRRDSAQVHSEGAESIVVLQRSRLTVSGLSRCGDSAVAVLGGHLISRDSIFKGEVDTPEVIVLAGTESERNHATATPLLLPAERTESKLLQHSHFGRASL
ncbi:unnamed protein product, partial [Ascophyllum nodosum]